jgi:uncharacterized protein YkwD
VFVLGTISEATLAGTDLTVHLDKVGLERLPKAKGKREKPPAAGNEAVTSAIFNLTNAFRKEQGLGPLKRSAHLDRAAQKYAETMARLQKVGHEVDGTKVPDRVRATGYVAAAVGENATGGHPEASMAVSMVGAWKRSPGHRKNMLRPNWAAIGVGVARDRAGRWYGCQVFGIPVESLSSFSVLIDNKSGKDVLIGRKGGVPAEVPAGQKLALAFASVGPVLVLEVRVAGARPATFTVKNEATYEITLEKGKIAVRERKDEGKP